MPRLNYSLVKMLENPGVNALVKRTAKRTGAGLKAYRRKITFEQRGAGGRTKRASTSPEAVALAYQSIKAAGKAAQRPPGTASL